MRARGQWAWGRTRRAPGCSSPSAPPIAGRGPVPSLCNGARAAGALQSLRLLTPPTRPLCPPCCYSLTSAPHPCAVAGIARGSPKPRRPRSPRDLRRHSRRPPTANATRPLPSATARTPTLPRSARRGRGAAASGVAAERGGDARRRRLRRQPRADLRAYLLLARPDGTSIDASGTPAAEPGARRPPGRSTWRAPSRRSS